MVSFNTSGIPHGSAPAERRPSTVLVDSPGVSARHTCRPVRQQTKVIRYRSGRTNTSLHQKKVSRGEVERAGPRNCSRDDTHIFTNMDHEFHSSFGVAILCPVRGSGRPRYLSCLQLTKAVYPLAKDSHTRQCLIGGPCCFPTTDIFRRHSRNRTLADSPFDQESWVPRWTSFYPCLTCSRVCYSSFDLSR